MNKACVFAGLCCIAVGLLAWYSIGFLAGMPMIITGIPVGTGLIIAPFVGGFFGEKVGNIFYSYNRNEHKLPMYSIAESKAKNGDFYKAKAEYKKLLLEYPKDLKLYLGVIEVAAVRLKNKDVASSFYKLGLKKLSKKEKRVLKECYEANICRINDYEDWEVDEEERVSSIKLKDYKDDLDWFREHFPEKMRKK